MKTTLFLAALCGLGSMQLGNIAQAQQGAPIVDPFKNQAAKTSYTNSRPEEPEKGFHIPMPKLSFSMPKFHLEMPKLPKFSSPFPPRQPGTPTMTQKIGGHWKEFLAKSKSTLMPWTNPAPARSFPDWQTSRGVAQRQKTEKPPFYKSLIPKPSEPEPSAPKSVNEFLSLPRPEY